jgi:hypothetical protein
LHVIPNNLAASMSVFDWFNAVITNNLTLSSILRFLSTISAVTLKRKTPHGNAGRFKIQYPYEKQS